MWVPKAILAWFEISKESFAGLREDLSAVRAERDALKSELLTTKANFDWLRARVNGLEIERAQLFERAYNIKIPVPEITRQPQSIADLGSDIFNDIGDKAARDLGMPEYAVATSLK